MRHTILEKVILLVSLSLYSILAGAQGFTEVSRTSGIDDAFVPDFLMGGGAAFFDYDNDGDMDIYVTVGNGADHLYRNDGTGAFEDVTQEAGLIFTSRYYTMGVVTGDVDNDGDKDIFLTTWGSNSGGNVLDKYARNLLYYNNGDGTFTERGADVGILDQAWSASATMGDVNLDGYLDIYVANYVINHGPLELNDDGTVRSYAPDCFTNFLYISNGDGTFTEQYDQYFNRNDKGCGLAAAITDYDNDAYPDLLVANDFGWWAETNRLYKNQYPAASLGDVSLSTSANIPMFGMGIAVGDYDEDLDIDYYVTNIRGNVLMRNNNTTGFIDVANPLGLENTFTNDLFTTGWGTQFLDYNNDSYLDLALANGWVATEPIVFTATQDQDKIYKNNGDGTFTDVSDEVGFNSAELGRGLIYGDIDNDGDLDIFVNVLESFESTDPHFLLYRNDNDNNINNWLNVKLVGVECNRDGYGSKVKAYFDDRVLIQELSAGSSFASQSSDIIHFGLGAVNEVDSLEIIWTGGRRQIVRDVNINSLNTIEEETSLQVITSTGPKFENSDLRVYPNPLSNDILHVILPLNTQLNDFKVSFYDVNGRSISHNDVAVVNSNELTVDLSSFSNGMYTLVLELENNTLQKLIMVNK